MLFILELLYTEVSVEVSEPEADGRAPGTTPPGVRPGKLKGGAFSAISSRASITVLPVVRI